MSHDVTYNYLLVNLTQNMNKNQISPSNVLIFILHSLFNSFNIQKMNDMLCYLYLLLTLLFIKAFKLRLFARQTSAVHVNIQLSHQLMENQKAIGQL